MASEHHLSPSWKRERSICSHLHSRECDLHSSSGDSCTSLSTQSSLAESREEIAISPNLPPNQRTHFSNKNNSKIQSLPAQFTSRCNLTGNPICTDRKYVMDRSTQAWLVVIACAVINALLFGIYRAYGLLYPAVIEEFGATRGEATWPFSLCMTMVHLSGPLSSGLTRFLSTRMVYSIGCGLSTLALFACYFGPQTVTMLTLNIGLIQGVGIGLTYVQNVAIINEYFDARRGLANGISMAGGTVGAFFVSPLLEKSLESFGLRQSYLVLAFLCLITLPMCLFLRQNPPKINRSNSQSRLSNALSKHRTSWVIGSSKNNACKGLNQLPICMISANDPSDHLNYMQKCKTNEFMLGLRQKIRWIKCKCSFKNGRVRFVISSVYFWLVMGSHLAYFWGVFTFTTVVGDLVADYGIDTSKVSQMITAFAFGDMIGRFGFGYFLDKKFCSTKTCSMLCTLLLAISLKSVTFPQTYYSFMVVSIILGFLSGAIVILINICLCEYLGTQAVPIAFGLTSFVCGITTLFRPMLIRYFRDEQGSYDSLFDLQSALAAFCALFWAMEIILSKRKLCTPH